jgi:hypothetical protein
MTLNQLRAVFDRVIYQWTQRLAHLVMVHVTAPWVTHFPAWERREIFRF